MGLLKCGAKATCTTNHWIAFPVIVWHCYSKEETIKWVKNGWKMNGKYIIIVTQHEKIGLMCTKYTPSHYFTYLTFCVRYTSSVNFIKISIVCYRTLKSFIDKLFFSTKLWNFEVHKSSQILCVHKPYFLMLGHLYSTYTYHKV